MLPLLKQGARLQTAALTSNHGGPYTFTLEHGECVALRGASGSGKSAFLRLVADLDPHEGEAWLDGQARSSMAAPAWRRQVVYQAAEPAWWARTVADHLSAPERARGSAWLKRLGLAPALLDSDVTLLSTGERQRMALVRSLATQPRVLLLDEPTAALDPESTLAVEALLAEQMDAGLSIVIVTHSTEQAARVAHRLVEVKDRQIEMPA